MCTDIHRIGSEGFNSGVTEGGELSHEFWRMLRAGEPKEIVAYKHLSVAVRASSDADGRY